jgi:hypothetical protein
MNVKRSKKAKFLLRRIVKTTETAIALDKKRVVKRIVEKRRKFTPFFNFTAFLNELLSSLSQNHPDHCVAPIEKPWSKALKICEATKSLKKCSFGRCVFDDERIHVVCKNKRGVFVLTCSVANGKKTRKTRTMKVAHEATLFCCVPFLCGEKILVKAHDDFLVFPTTREKPWRLNLQQKIKKGCVRSAAVSGNVLLFTYGHGNDEILCSYKFESRELKTINSNFGKGKNKLFNNSKADFRIPRLLPGKFDGVFLLCALCLVYILYTFSES